VLVRNAGWEAPAFQISSLELCDCLYIRSDIAPARFVFCLLTVDLPAVFILLPQQPVSPYLAK
jgi:hypothetical protein